MTRYTRLLTLLSAAAAVALACPALAEDKAPPNLLPNGSFEQGGQGKDATPTGWRSNTWGGEGSYAWAETGRTDKRCVHIHTDTPGDLAWQAKVTVFPDSVYRLSGWIKTENVTLHAGRGALLNVHQINAAQTPPVTGTTDWTHVQCDFETGPQSELLVHCLFGGWGQATGKAWYDDVTLQLIHKGDRKNPSATVNLDKPAGKINPYIYGQFIEHLGRCIYGGVWAEMLEDRKFANLVTSSQSPWKRLGGEVGWSLTMDVERPYVGDWSAKLFVTDRAPKTRAHGIVQGGLGVLEGKAYTGYVYLAGKGTVRATLAWGPGAKQRQTVDLKVNAKDFTKHSIQFTAGAATDEASLSLGVVGPGEVWLASPSLMPADNVRGMRADTLTLLKELDSPIYRWPGGNFVSGYDWRDGIGPRDLRPPRKNPAWQGIEHNDFGIDEFIAYCREIRTEPLVVVNTGLGSPELAAAMVEYCNGPATSKWGKRRAANGHAKPYSVVWWGVGNEMYGGWQLGHTTVEAYTTRHNEFVRAMRVVDPKIKLVAVGATGKWSEATLTKCASAMDMLSEHFYCQSKPGLEAHVAQIPDNVRRKALAHRKYHKTLPSLQKRKTMIPIALDEWNYWYGKHLYGELGTRYFLKDALGIARGLHEMYRNNDVFGMAMYAQTVNVIGCIKTTKTAAAFATTGLPLKLYRKHFGPDAVEVKGRATPLDVVASITADGKAATIAVVNPTEEPRTLKLTVKGRPLAKRATTYTITGKTAMSYNDPGKAPNVKIVEAKDVPFAPAKLTLPPMSIVLYVVPITGK